MVEINNLTKMTIDENWLRKTAQRVLKKENRKKDGLSIALVSEGRIRELNKIYLNKNRATDILAFPQKELGSEQLVASRALGELIICPGVIKKNAERMKILFEKELSLCLIHGILHLLGYEHERTETERKKMEERQQYYLSQTIK